jgi:hypothetical protein
VANLVRSFRIGAGRLALGAALSLYTVETGHTALLKSVNVHNLSPTATNVDVLLTALGSQILVARLRPAGSSYVHFECWFAVPEHEDIVLWNGNAGSIDYYASGALLPGVVPTSASTKPG